MEKYLDIVSLIGGESDDFYRASVNNSFAEGRNIEIRKNGRGVVLEAGLIDTGWNINGNILRCVSLESLGIDSGGVIITTSTGRIYLNGGEKKNLSSTYKGIIGIGANNTSTGDTYIYFLTETLSGVGKIHRSDTTLDTWTEDFKTYTVTSGNISRIPVINKANSLYFGVKDTVFTLSKIENLEPSLILPSRETIVHLGSFQDRIRVYSNMKNTSTQYIWDGYQTVSDFRQEWVNMRILGGVQDGAFDWLITGFNENYASLVRVSGIEKQDVKVNLEASSISRIFNGNISIRDGILYISGGMTGKSTERGVYTFGVYYPNSSSSLVQSYTGTGANFLESCHIETLSYFADSDGKVRTASHNNPPSVYATSGYFDSMVYQASLWDEMLAKYIKIGYECNSGQVKIYVRTDTENSFTLLDTITGPDKKKTIMKNNFQAINLGNFNEFQIRIELIRGSTDKTPVFKRLTGAFEVINENK